MNFEQHHTIYIRYYILTYFFKKIKAFCEKIIFMTYFTKKPIYFCYFHKKKVYSISVLSKTTQMPINFIKVFICQSSILLSVAFANIASTSADGALSISVTTTAAIPPIIKPGMIS